jgi:hypothetical protein
LLLVGIALLAGALLALWLGRRGVVPLLSESYAISSAFAVVVAFSLLLGLGLTVVHLF